MMMRLYAPRSCYDSGRWQAHSNRCMRSMSDNEEADGQRTRSRYLLREPSAADSSRCLRAQCPSDTGLYPLSLRRLEAMVNTRLLFGHHEGSAGCDGIEKAYSSSERCPTKPGH